jgi:hypothetical protein
VDDLVGDRAESVSPPWEPSLPPITPSHPQGPEPARPPLSEPRTANRRQPPTAASDRAAAGRWDPLVDPLPIALDPLPTPGPTWTDSTSAAAPHQGDRSAATASTNGAATPRWRAADLLRDRDGIAPANGPSGRWRAADLLVGRDDQPEATGTVRKWLAADLLADRGGTDATRSAHGRSRANDNGGAPASGRDIGDHGANGDSATRSRRGTYDDGAATSGHGVRGGDRATRSRRGTYGDDVAEAGRRDGGDGAARRRGSGDDAAVARRRDAGDRASTSDHGFGDDDAATNGRGADRNRWMGSRRGTYDHGAAGSRRGSGDDAAATSWDYGHDGAAGSRRSSNDDAAATSWDYGDDGAAGSRRGSGDDAAATSWDYGDDGAAASGRGFGDDTNAAGYGADAPRWRAADLLDGAESPTNGRARRGAESAADPQVNGHAGTSHDGNGTGPRWRAADLLLDRRIDGAAAVADHGPAEPPAEPRGNRARDRDIATASTWQAAELLDGPTPHAEPDGPSRWRAAGRSESGPDTAVGKWRAADLLDRRDAEAGGSGRRHTNDAGGSGRRHATAGSDVRSDPVPDDTPRRHGDDRHATSPSRVPPTQWAWPKEPEASPDPHPTRRADGGSRSAWAAADLLDEGRHAGGRRRARESTRHGKPDDEDAGRHYRP